MSIVLPKTRQKSIMEENFDITSILEVSYDEEEKALQKRGYGAKLESVPGKCSYRGQNKGSKETPVIQLSDESCDGEGEVILGLIPPADWVGNHPSREVADIELEAAKRLQAHEVPIKTELQKPKKEEEEDGDSEDLVIDYEDEIEEIKVKEEKERLVDDVINEGQVKSEGVSGEDQNNERQDAHGDEFNKLEASYGSSSQETFVDPQDIAVFGCNSCPLSFSDPFLLSKHVKIHPLRRKAFICRLCFKTNTVIANLKRHMLTHSGEKPFTCNICNKLFTTAYNLKLHMRIHSGYKPYKCNQCTKSFYHKIGLKKHYLTHLKMHTSQEETSFEADNYNSSHATANMINPVQPNQLALMQNMSVENLNADNALPQNNNYPNVPELIPNSKEVVLFQAKNGVTVTCKLPFENVLPNIEPVFHSTTDKDKQQSSEKNMVSPPVVTSVSSQNKSNYCLTNSSPSHLSTSEVGNTYMVPPELNSVTSFQSESVNNVIYTQPSPETYYIPVYVNGQLYYIIPSVPSPSSVVNNQTEVQPSMQPVNLLVNPEKALSQESQHAPSHTSAVSNGLHPLLLSSNSPTISVQSPATINSTSIQQEQKPILCNTCKAPVTVYTG